MEPHTAWRAGAGEAPTHTQTAASAGPLVTTIARGAQVRAHGPRRGRSTSWGGGPALQWVVGPENTCFRKRFTTVSALCSVTPSGISHCFCKQEAPSLQSHHGPRVRPYLPACTGLCPSSPPSPRCGDRLEERGKGKLVTLGAWSSPLHKTTCLHQAQGTPETAAL